MSIFLVLPPSSLTVMYLDMVWVQDQIIPNASVLKMVPLVIFSEVSFQCLASWKDGSDMYMYGGFGAPGLTEKDDIYRCFVSKACAHVFTSTCIMATLCCNIMSSVHSCVHYVHSWWIRTSTLIMACPVHLEVVLSHMVNDHEKLLPIWNNRNVKSTW